MWQNKQSMQDKIATSILQFIVLLALSPFLLIFLSWLVASGRNTESIENIIILIAIFIVAAAIKDISKFKKKKITKTTSKEKINDTPIKNDTTISHIKNKTTQPIAITVDPASSIKKYLIFIFYITLYLTTWFIWLVILYGIAAIFKQQYYIVYVLLHIPMIIYAIILPIWIIKYNYKRVFN